MRNEYFVVYFGEDGISISPHDKVSLQKFVDEFDENVDGSQFVKDGNKDFYMDGGEYPIYKYLIIKGEVITPKPVEIVKKYEL